MPAKLLTGKEVAQKMDLDIQKEVQELKARGVNPALRIMIVGDAPDSVTYANSAKKMAEKNGIACEIEQLAGTMSQDEFVGILKDRNADKGIHGIIVMRPFPKQIREDVVKYILSPEKDVDCFNPVNAGKIMAGDMTGFPPATPQAVMEILRFYQIPMSGKEAVKVTICMGSSCFARGNRQALHALQIAREAIPPDVAATDVRRRSAHSVPSFVSVPLLSNSLTRRPVSRLCSKRSCPSRSPSFASSASRMSRCSSPGRFVASWSSASRWCPP